MTEFIRRIINKALIKYFEDNFKLSNIKLRRIIPTKVLINLLMINNSDTPVDKSKMEIYPIFINKIKHRNKAFLLIIIFFLSKRINPKKLPKTKKSIPEIRKA